MGGDCEVLKLSELDHCIITNQNITFFNKEKQIKMIAYEKLSAA